MEDIIKLKSGESAVRLFSMKKDAKSIRGKIFTLLNGMEVKYKYTTHLHDGNLHWTLSIVKIAGGVIKSVEYYMKGDKHDNNTN